MSVQLGSNFFHFGPNVNVLFDCANWFYSLITSVSGLWARFTFTKFVKLLQAQVWFVNFHEFFWKSHFWRVFWTNQCFTGSPFQKHSFTSPFITQKITYTYWSKFLHFTLRMPKRFYWKVKSKGLIQKQFHYPNREGCYLELLLASKEHNGESQHSKLLL